ncbi:Kinesin-Like Protein Kif12 [Manis pentadactyla]|nr:Kinesin-Like Protein Kif12 [Manis pentadactyla]
MKTYCLGISSVATFKGNSFSQQTPENAVFSLHPAKMEEEYTATRGFFASTPAYGTFLMELLQPQIDKRFTKTHMALAPVQKSQLLVATYQFSRLVRPPVAGGVMWQVMAEVLEELVVEQGSPAENSINRAILGCLDGDGQDQIVKKDCGHLQAWNFPITGSTAQERPEARDGWHRKDAVLCSSPQMGSLRYALVLLLKTGRIVEVTSKTQQLRISRKLGYLELAGESLGNLWVKERQKYLHLQKKLSPSWEALQPLPDYRKAYHQSRLLGFPGYLDPRPDMSSASQLLLRLIPGLQNQADMLELNRDGAERGRDDSRVSYWTPALSQYCAGPIPESQL